MTRLEISDASKHGPLSFDLVDILDVLECEGSTRDWRIESLEAVAKPSSGLDVLELERQVGASEGGLVVTWKKLRQVAEALHQTINCTVSSGSEIRIEAQDTTRWIVFFKAPTVEQRIRSRFQQVRLFTE